MSNRVKPPTPPLGEEIGPVLDKTVSRLEGYDRGGEDDEKGVQLDRLERFNTALGEGISGPAAAAEAAQGALTGDESVEPGWKGWVCVLGVSLGLITVHSGH
jgi:hypothetical protein